MGPATLSWLLAFSYMWHLGWDGGVGVKSPLLSSTPERGGLGMVTSGVRGVRARQTRSSEAKQGTLRGFLAHLIHSSLDVTQGHFPV